MLKRDRTEDLAVRMPLDALLGLDRCLRTVGPMTIEDDAACKLVDDLDAAVAHDVVDIASQQHMRMKRAIELGQKGVVLLVVKTAASERLLEALDAGVGQLDVARVLVRVEMDARPEGGNDASQSLGR